MIPFYYVKLVSGVTALIYGLFVIAVPLLWRGYVEGVFWTEFLWAAHVWIWSLILAGLSAVGVSFVCWHCAGDHFNGEEIIDFIDMPRKQVAVLLSLFTILGAFLLDLLFTLLSSREVFPLVFLTVSAMASLIVALPLGALLMPKKR